MIQKDADNTIVGCDKCGSRNIKKDGWQYWAKGKKRQRWHCKACNKKSLIIRLCKNLQSKQKKDKCILYL